VTSEEFWCVLRERRNITKYADGQQGNAMCHDLNHTEFEIPDPDLMPAEVREEMLEEVLSNLRAFALGY